MSLSVTLRPVEGKLEAHKRDHAFGRQVLALLAVGNYARNK
ncbi:MAG: hypothetical protein RIB47_05930 [Cyclobacteriaceae bacterium]